MTWAFRRLVRKRVVINQADQAFAGILWAQRGPLLVLRNAELLQPGTAPQPMDGEVVVERHSVHFIQIVG
ncbi:hypothetical protein JNUCC0626_20000 [Lentzea sp. JNUCC 0626]|uniref:hypothetical protein n=1 Tax=Lentzea sp. JNUCC 0626 TaxID=3367513 RepID=UPI0037482C14